MTRFFFFFSRSLEYVCSEIKEDIEKYETWTCYIDDEKKSNKRGEKKTVFFFFFASHFTIRKISQTNRKREGEIFEI